MDSTEESMYDMAPNDQKYRTLSPSSPNSPDTAADSSARRKQHKRTYQACAPCRIRKVKCDLGSVDNPHKPPCARCLREQKNCVFADTRRKDALKRSPSQLATEEGADAKRQRVEGSSAPKGRGIGSPRLTAPNSPKFAGRVRRSPMMVDPEMVTKSADIMKQETYNAGHTLSILVDAATCLRQSEQNESRTDPDASPSLRSQLQAKYSPESLRVGLEVWNRCRWRSIGLIKPEEGIAYVTYFYEHCAPFTPVSIPNYSDPATHETLLEKEPFLAMTILTIASRFMELDGHGGKVSRPAMIHERFWEHLHSMFNSLFWAQEQFGGGFSGGGKAYAAKVSHALPLYGLRSITTVESLLLLTEWHPRAMHFPPAHDPVRLLTTPDSDDAEEDSSMSRLLNGTGSERRDSWLEPSWRSNRMIWSLLNSALGLSFDIGIFEDKTPDQINKDAPYLPRAEVEAYYFRAAKLRDLLWTFFVQTSGRLEIVSKLPPLFLQSFHQSNADLRIQEAVTYRRRMLSPHNSHHPQPPYTWTSRHSDNPAEAINGLWQEIAAIMKSANETMFGTAERTRHVINSGEYRNLIMVYAPLLAEWKAEFERCTHIAEPMRSILLIEFEYARIYINSLPIQAFVNRAVASTPSKQNIDPSSSRSDSVTSNGPSSVPLEDVRKWMQDDAPFVKELISACQNVLKIVSDGKSIKHSDLKFLTVRAYFRVMTASVFLLKSFVVGAYAEDVVVHLKLLRDSSDALRKNIVDDVHIGNTFADMTKAVSMTLMPHLRRFQRPHNSGAVPSRAPSQTPHLGSPRMGAINGFHAPTSHPSHAQSGPPNWHNHSNGNGYHATSMSNEIPDIFASPETAMNQLPDYNPNDPVPVMPPPDFFSASFNDPEMYPSAADSNNLGLSSSGGFGSGNGGGGGDWIAPDLSSLTQLAVGQTLNHVTTTHLGPAVNGIDFLDHIRFHGSMEGYTNGNGTPLMQSHWQNH